MSLLASLTSFAVLAQTGPGTDPSGQGPVATLPGTPTAGPRTIDPNVLTVPDVAWRALLPLIVLGLGAVVLLTITSVWRRKVPKGAYALYTVAVALLAMATAVPLWARVQGWDHLFWWDLDTGTTGPFSTIGSACVRTVQDLPGPGCGAVGIDGFSLAITFLICTSVVLAALFASSYLRREDLDGPELYVLLLLSAAGGVIMAVANDLIVLFLGLETLSIAVYVLAAFHRKKVQSQEAGLKYFVLGGFSSAFFLYGVAMVYGATATTNLVNIKTLLAQSIPAPIVTQDLSIPGGSWNPELSLNSPLLFLGIGLMLIGLGFKVSAVPFHFWSPDVYDGSPSPVVVFMASGVKAAGFAALVRVFVVGFESTSFDWRPAVGALALLSMVVGSLLAIVQSNVKRTLAYSSISHAGFILMALQSVSADGNKAIVFYLVTYTFMVAGSFGIIGLVARRGDGHSNLDDFRGLSESNPMLAFLFTVFLLAQAGVPFTSGFVAKLYTIVAAIDANITWMAIVAMVSSVIAAFLYLRIIVAMYMSGDTEDGTIRLAASRKIPVPFGAAVALAVCFVVTIGVGIFPGPLTDFSADSRPALVRMGEPEAAPPPAGILPGAPSGAAQTQPAPR